MCDEDSVQQEAQDPWWGNVCHGFALPVILNHNLVHWEAVLLTSYKWPSHFACSTLSSAPVSTMDSLSLFHECYMLSLWWQILTKYLQEIEEFELRLQLATDVEVFDVRIEVVFEVISPVRPTWKQERSKCVYNNNCKNCTKIKHPHGMLLLVSRAPQTEAVS